MYNFICLLLFLVYNTVIFLVSPLYANKDIHNRSESSNCHGPQKAINSRWCCGTTEIKIKKLIKHLYFFCLNKIIRL